MDEYGFLIGVAIVLFVGGIIGLVWYVKRYKLSTSQHSKMQADLPVILQNEKIAKQQLQSDDIVITKHYSSLGYKFIDYRTKYNAPNNFNIILDDTNKKLAFYVLLPYKYSLHDYKDITKCELLINNAQVDVTSISSSVGTSVGGIGIGVGVSNGLARQLVDVMNIFIYFRDGESASISCIDNLACYTDEDYYMNCLIKAKQICARIENIIKENQ